MRERLLPPAMAAAAACLVVAGCAGIRLAGSGWRFHQGEVPAFAYVGDERRGLFYVACGLSGTETELLFVPPGYGEGRKTELRNKMVLRLGDRAVEVPARQVCADGDAAPCQLSSSGAATQAQLFAAVDMLRSSGDARFTLEAAKEPIVYSLSGASAAIGKQQAACSGAGRAVP